jgi:outer membrane protein
MIKYILITVVILLAITGTCAGQDPLWTLEQCIAYAKINNLSVQQNVLNERVAKLNLEQSKWSQLPDVSISSGTGRSFGRSIDPTSNTFINSTYDYMGLNGSSNILLFGWFGKRHTIARNDLIHRASKAELSQLENDIALNITNGYLRVLLAKEQIKISLHQLEISNKQAERTESLYNAGRSTGQDLAQVRAQLSNDSAGYFKAVLLCNQSKIDIKALLNLELSDLFDIASLNVQQIDLGLLSASPEDVYNEALSKSGNVRNAALKVQSARKNAAISKSNLYPRLTMGLSGGTNYSSNYTEFSPDGSTKTVTWGKQFQNNFSQSVSIGLSIPVFNGFASKYAVKQAKLSLQNTTLQAMEVRLKLKQDIYKAFNDMQAAYHTYKALNESASYAQTALDFAQKRFDKGLINAIDLLLAQNTSFKANIDVASAQYDFVFKSMVMDYFLGRKLFEN